MALNSRSDLRSSIAQCSCSSNLLEASVVESLRAAEAARGEAGEVRLQRRERVGEQSTSERDGRAGKEDAGEEDAVAAESKCVEDLADGRGPANHEREQ